MSINSKTFGWLIMLAGILLYTSCKKEQDVYLREYLNDEGINLSIKGTGGSYDLEERFILNTYSEYYKSTISSTANNTQQIKIKRFSEDFQSVVAFTFTIDNNKELIYKETQVVLSIIKGNTLINLSMESGSKNLNINTFTYNEDSGQLTFDFNYKKLTDEIDLYVTGDADVVVYELLD